MSENKGKKEMSEAALAANRQNAQKSTGPKTPAGKEAIKYNAAKHFGYCNDPLIPGESIEDYHKFAAALAESLQFHNGLQFTLMDNLIAELWCWQRFVGYEANIYIYTPDQGFFLDEMEKLTRIKNRRWQLIERMFKQFRLTKDRMASAFTINELMKHAQTAFDKVAQGHRDESSDPLPVIPIPTEDEAVVMVDFEALDTATVCPEKWDRRRKQDNSGGYNKMIDILLGLIRTPNARVIDIIRNRSQRRPKYLKYAQLDALEDMYARSNPPQSDVSDA